MPALGEALVNAIHQMMAYVAMQAASIFLLDDCAEDLSCKACAGPVDGDFCRAVDEATGFVTRSIQCAPLCVKGGMFGAL